MKIAVASDDGITLTGHVGRCEMFIVFEVLNKEIVNIEKRINSFTMHKTSEYQHKNHNHTHTGSGKHTGIIYGLKDCSYLICSKCGPGLVEDLFNNGVQIILTEEMDAQEAVKLFVEGKLKSNPEKECKEHNH